MHEKALIREIRQKIFDVAREQGAKRVIRVRLWIGALSELGESQLRESWPRMVEGTPAEDSALEVQTSADIRHLRAMDIILTSLDIEGPTPQLEEGRGKEGNSDRGPSRPSAREPTLLR